MIPDDDSMLGQNLVDVRNEERRNALRGEQLEPLTTQAVMPLTGEVVELGQPSEVARALDELRGLKRQLDEVRVVLEDALRIESERQGTKTLHLDDLTATISGGEKVEYDETELANELRDLGLPEERLGEVIVTTVSYRVDQRVARSVAAANPRYAEALERHRRVVPDRWRVSVKKKGAP